MEETKGFELGGAGVDDDGEMVRKGERKHFFEKGLLVTPIGGESGMEVVEADFAKSNDLGVG